MKESPGSIRVVWGALVLTSLVGRPSALAQTVPAIVGTSDRCHAAVFPRPKFEPDSALNVLVLSFSGHDDSSKKHGDDVSRRITTALPIFVNTSKIQLPSGEPLTHKNISVEYISCTVNSHAEARRLGKLSDAQLVIWGLASTNAEELGKLITKVRESTQKSVKLPLLDQIPITNTGTMIQNAIQIEWVLPEWPPLTGVFQTYLTAVDVPSFDLLGAKPKKVKTLAVFDLGFRELAGAQPHDLYRLVAAVAASRAERYDLASAITANVESSRPASTTQNTPAENLLVHSELQSALAGLHGLSESAVQPRAGLSSLVKAVRECEPDSISCRWISLMNLGWTLERAGDRKNAERCYKEAYKLAMIDKPDPEDLTLRDRVKRLEQERETPLIAWLLPLLGGAAAGIATAIAIPLALSPSYSPPSGTIDPRWR